jgi:phosphoglycerol transferase MdoB-like AlkP superfamily enzyme
MTKTKHRVPIFLNWLKGYLRLLGLAMLIMSALRLLWFIYYRRGDELTHFLYDFLSALWLGARFDLSAFCHISTVSFLIWLVWLLVGPTQWSQQLWRLQQRLWIFLVLFLSFILVADFTFYGYFQDHFNAMIFGLVQDDTNAILKTVWKNYPVIKIFAVSGLSIWGLQKWFQRLWPQPPHQLKAQGASSIWLNRAIAAASFVALGLGARGTFGLFPLEIMHTAISSHAFINTLSFNGVHALANAIRVYDQQRQAWNENLLQLGYAQSPTQAITDFTGITPPPNLSDPAEAIQFATPKRDLHVQRPHVVVVLMESWGSDWMKRQSPTFDIQAAFAKHRKEDLFTANMLPASVATIGSLGSLVVDLPHRFYSPFLTESAYLGVNFSTAPARIFQAQGYQTHFVYGGNLGWRSIDKFLPRQGFQFLHGENEIKKQIGGNWSEDELTHDWGVYDEYVFDYTEKLLAKAQQPQFIFILTTSNHPPYTLPPHYQGPPLEFTNDIDQSLIGDLNLAHDRLRVYQYANQHLGLFLDRLKTGPLADKTVVAATGDHSFYIRPYENLDFYSKWAVPFYLYTPAKLRPPKEFQFTHGSHLDVFPTLYHLLFSELTYRSLGHNLLDPRLQPWTYHAPSSTTFDGKYGAIVSPKGHLVASLCWMTAQQEFQACTAGPEHENLRKRLVSLMGTADFIYEHERRLNLENPPRK